MDEMSAPVWEAARRLEQVWEASADHWRDNTSRRFEREHWLPLAETTLNYVDAARDLEATLAEIRRLAYEV